MAQSGGTSTLLEAPLLNPGIDHRYHTTAHTRIIFLFLMRSTLAGGEQRDDTGRAAAFINREIDRRFQLCGSKRGRGGGGGQTWPDARIDDEQHVAPFSRVWKPASDSRGFPFIPRDDVNMRQCL